MALTTIINSVGKREDLADIISVVDAKECVLTSTITKGKKPAAALTEWQVDSFGAVNTTGTVDGVDVTTFEDYGANRARLGNYIQLFRRKPQVSNLQEAVAVVAGINNPDPNGVAGATEFARAKKKATVQLKRDIEATLLSDNSAQADAGPGTPFQTRGLGKWLSTVADGVQAQPASVLLPAGQVYDHTLTGTQTLANFTEDALRSLLQTRWSGTGSTASLIGIVGSDIKNAVSDFTRYLPAKTIAGSVASQVRFYNADIKSKTVSTTVDIYSGDYGDVEMHLSAFVPNTYRGYILDPKYLELRTAMAPNYRDLPDLGGGPRGIIDAILALVVNNPLAHAKIAC